jgi:hypothetical protein
MSRANWEVKSNIYYPSIFCCLWVYRSVCPVCLQEVLQECCRGLIWALYNLTHLRQICEFPGCSLDSHKKELAIVGESLLTCMGVRIPVRMN